MLSCLPSRRLEGVPMTGCPGLRQGTAVIAQSGPGAGLGDRP